MRESASSGSGKGGVSKLTRQDLLELLLDEMRASEEQRATIAELTGLEERLKQKLDEKDAQIEHLKERLDEKDARIAALVAQVEGDGEVPVDGALSEGDPAPAAADAAPAVDADAALSADASSLDDAAPAAAAAPVTLSEAVA